MQQKGHVPEVEEQGRSLGRILYQILLLPMAVKKVLRGLAAVAFLQSIVFSPAMIHRDLIILSLQF